MGTMNCFTLGTLKSTAVDLDLRVQDSGSLNSTTWAWKLNSATSTSTSDVYYGEPDRDGLGIVSRYLVVQEQWVHTLIVQLAF